MDKATDQHNVEKKLFVSRNELLDIGLRNSLLNFRTSVKSLEIIEELSEEIFNQLYLEGKTMSLASRSAKKTRLRDTRPATATFAIVVEEIDAKTINTIDDAAENGDSATLPPTSTIHGDEDKARRQTDNRLETGLGAPQLLTRLLKIETEARSYMEEQGVNVLYLALGFLHWYEADSATEAHKAPLILVPVELLRASGKDSFSLQHNGDDLIDNLSLAAKLKSDFGLNLATYIDDGAQDASELPAVGDYYRQVAAGVATQKRWQVHENEVVLGFFSFGKFLMFNDLDSKNWPQDKQPANHPVMRRLLGAGFGDQRQALADDTGLDAVIAPGDMFFVKDADSSQTAAMWEARAGNNLVIQGPPGTGKSQTITNIIADMLRQNKTVLFVAEKMAALEVVKRRLDESHLGDAVLELHSQKSTKKAVLAELGRTLAQGQPLVRSSADDMATLKSLRDTLNGYAGAVNEPDPVSGLPFIAAVGHYMSLKRAHPDLAQMAFAPMATWSQQIFRNKRVLVDELARHIAEMGTPKRSPFWGSGRSYFSPVEQNLAAGHLVQAQRLLADVIAAAGALAQRLCLSRPVALTDIDVTCRAARRAAEAPRLQGVCISTQDWQLRRDAIHELLAAGSRMAQVRAKHAGQLIDSAWDQDVLELRQHFVNHGDKWWRVASSDFRSARARLLGLSKGALPDDNSAVIAVLDDVLDYQQQQKTYERLELLGAALFGAQWNRQQSDWPVLQQLAAWVIALHDDLGKGNIPAGLVDFLSGHADASGMGDGIIEDLLARLQTLLSDAAQVLGFDEHAARQMQAVPIDECAAQLAAWTEALPAMYQMARFNQLVVELREAGLEDVAMLGEGLIEVETLLPCFDLSWYAGLVERAYARHPSLQQFDRIRHEHQIQRFRALDLESLDHAKAHLAQGLWQRMPNINLPGEMATLRAELNKKRRHIPIRQLISKAGRAILQAKPVFMMSPLSIANFLPPGAIEFDVVIFDEASQVKTVDAFGAILRGKQVIVVGDTQQMPPTNFFGRDVDIDDEENITSDIESILSMFKYAGAQERYLRWHYRSRHESLIAVSNVEFYERKLMVFPSPGHNPDATGLRLRHLPTALYDRGRTRTNKGEAQAVAHAVIDHARNRPHQSLGVVAFSVAQRDLIQMEVELLSRQQPELAAFFNACESEPFFVKNLENVQGDERDVIYISIGYGRNESGKIAKEFGPVNRDGGQRRLNVLITRAKLAMEVFCNFRAADLELDVNATHGVRALKNFLHYAETGELAMATETGKDVDSPFELEVMTALLARGYQIEPQIGSAGYFIDLGVKDPDAPGRYILAIECDGAAYHSSRSARDRDRLRQGVLEGLGWRFHRIWSTDWFRNPAQELERVIDAIEAARIALPAIIKKPQPLAVIERAPTPAEQPVAAPPAYRKVQLPLQSGVLQEEKEAFIIDLIGQVLAVEAPIHQDELTRRLMDAYGLKRMGIKIEAVLGAAIATGTRRQLLHRHGAFIYLDARRSAVLRNRTELAAAEKKIELVAPEELDMALLDIIRSGFSMTPDAAISGALELLGFGRATAKISGAVQARIDALLLERRLKLVDARLVLGEVESDVARAA